MQVVNMTLFWFSGEAQSYTWPQIELFIETDITHVEMMEWDEFFREGVHNSRTST